MSAVTYNFYIEQGSDFTISFEYLDVNSLPINVSKYCARLRMRDNNGTVRLYSSAASSSNYSLLKNGTTGTITWVLPAATTEKFIFDNAIYDLDLTAEDNSEKIRISTGRIEIIKTNFPECPGSSDVCKDCISISSGDSEGIGPPIVTQTITGSLPTPSQTPTNPCQLIQEDLCDYLCRDLDMFAKMYSGSAINIVDNTVTTDTIVIQDSGVITNVEVSISKLKHSYPQDLSFILTPPSGDKILLSSKNKINNYNATSGLNFTFSDKAIPNIYLNNRSNFDFYVNILDKRDSYGYESNLTCDFDSIIGTSPSGSWTLSVRDDDIGASGTIDGWGLIFTYRPPDYIE